MTRRQSLFHGGAPGMNPGDTIRPDQGHRKHIDGCHICAAHAAGISTPFDPATPAGWVYATRDQSYARYYASLARGDLYRVELVGGVEPSTEDPFPSWRASRAKVVSVVERGVTLTMAQRERLFIRWGGTPEEFSSMLAAVGADRR